MVKTLSNMLPLGSKAPEFTLYDAVSDKNLSLHNLKSDKGTAIMFICNHCPFVKHIQSKLVEVADKYMKNGISFIAISSNDAKKYPDDSPENMKIEAMHNGYRFPYLYDETQEIAKAYDAACTPDFYLFDASLKCVYRGRFDESTPGNNKPVSGQDLSKAIEQLLSGQTINEDQQPSIGCNIKWK